MKRWSWMCCALLLAACTQDSPTEAGGGLLPPDAIRTFEVILPAERFLVRDTSFGLYASEPVFADFTIIANEYRGAVNSRVLLRYAIPSAVTVTDTLGVARVDSMPSFVGGRVRVLIDTLASTPRPTILELYQNTETWDRLSATWTHRVDTTGASIPWTVPGGSPGALIGSGVWTEGDSAFVPVDSATIALWSDTIANPEAGAILVSATADTRLRTVIPTLRLDVRSTLNPDTLFEIVLAPTRTFIFEPIQPDSVPEPRIGGTPSWRTMLQLRERLDTITVPCPGAPGCMVQLGDVNINYAALVLQPVTAPTGFEPEISLVLTLHAVLTSPEVPLQRSPVSAPVGFALSSLPPSSFLTPGAPPVEVPATDFFRLVLSEPDSAVGFVPSTLALLHGGSPQAFGIGTFEEMPGLRLIITQATELRTP